MCERKRQADKILTPEASEKPDLYDLTLPKTGYNFMRPVRQWEKRMGFLTPLRWDWIGLFSFLHFVALFWTTSNLYHGLLPKWQTVAFGYVLSNVALFGVLGGPHRYWCHRSFKAKLPLQIILLLCYSIAGHYTIKRWVHDHRVHHKHSDTDADPHNARRGFFFAHIGWFMMQRHPRYIEEAAKIDMSDILDNKLVMFHTKHFILIRAICCFIIPTLVPLQLWDETWGNAILSQGFLRYLYVLHCIFCINSFAHMYGNRPYDKNILPTENWGVSAVAMGEGWHNYHHSFPWDYRAAEIPYRLNGTTILLDFFARISWAYDLKTASSKVVKSVQANKGRGVMLPVAAPELKDE